jgi:hypothetical protein
MNLLCRHEAANDNIYFALSHRHVDLFIFVYRRCMDSMFENTCHQLLSQARKYQGGGGGGVTARCRRVWIRVVMVTSRR